MLREGARRQMCRCSFSRDLEADAGWKEAVSGCDFVLPRASPLRHRCRKTKDELICAGA